VRYKWKEAVQRKGDGARWHIGLIAQEVERAFAARGLDAFEIGLLCRDPVIETVVEKRLEERPVYETVEIEDVVEEPTVPVVRQVPVTETVEVERLMERETGEWRYGLRYDEAFALEVAWLRRELAAR
jgi:hypothetical protein